MNTIGNQGAGDPYIQPGEGTNIKATSADVSRKIGEARDSIEAASDATKAFVGANPDLPVLPEGQSVEVDPQLLSLTKEIMDKTMAVNSALDELATLVAEDEQQSLTKDKETTKEVQTKSSSTIDVGSEAHVGASVGAKANATDQEQAWFAATCFLTNFAIATMKASRTLSDMTAVQQAASIKMREQERSSLQTEVDSIIDKGEQDAKQLEWDGISKMVSAGINLGVTIGVAAYGAKSPDADDKRSSEERFQAWKKTQTSMEGVSKTATTATDGAFQFVKMDCVKNSAKDDAIRANTKDKYDTTVANRRATTDYLSKLRDTLNDFLSSLQRLLEEGYRVGQFTRN